MNQTSNTNTYIMVCVQKPSQTIDRKDQTWPNWHVLIDEYAKIPKPMTGIEQPTDNIWLFRVSESLSCAAQFLALCNRIGVLHKTYLLADAPIPCA